MGFAALPVIGGIQAAVGLAGLFKEANTPYQDYQPTDAFRRSESRAERMAQQGYTPQERAAFETGQARKFNTARQNVLDQSGGSLASAINKGLNAANVFDQNQFAASDAALRRQNIRYADQFAMDRQRMSEANVNMANQYKMAKEQSYGQAMQAGIGNIGSYFMQQDALSAYENALAQQFGSGGQGNQGLPSNQNMGGATQGNMNQIPTSANVGVDLSNYGAGGGVGFNFNPLPYSPTQSPFGFPFSYNNPFQ